MTCEKAAEVHAYHDGELDPSRGGALEAHLLGCADCRDLLEELRGLTRMLNDAELPAMPDAALARLEGAWREVSERALLRITSWMTGVAAALLVGALLVWSGVRNDALNRAVVADPVVLATAAEPPGEPNSELIQVAQWMADDLSIGGGGAAGRR
jgi:anti-sigma factor RsiW